jgi:hypothetical protein
MMFIDISTPKFPNKFAVVDDCDYHQISKHKWSAHEAHGYVYATRRNPDGGPIIRMHRQIMGFPDTGVDHKNRVTLDNRRYNLRLASKSQNTQNSKTRTDSLSGYKGVTWDKANKTWRARITVNSNQIFLGHYFCLLKAAKAYDKAAVKYFGEFANANLQAVAICKLSERENKT